MLLSDIFKLEEGKIDSTMSKKINIFLTAVFLMSLVFQGIRMYACHTEGTVHFESTCCEIPQTKTCCQEDQTSSETGIHAKCCFELELDFIKSTNATEHETVHSLEQTYGGYYLPVIFSEINEKNLLCFEYAEINKTPPHNKSQLYALINSYLC